MSNQLSHQALYVFSGRVLSQIFGFLVPIYLVRVFSKDVFGDYRALLLILILLSRIFRLGMVEALIYAVRKEGGSESKNVFATNIFLHTIGIFLVIIINFFAEQISDFFNVVHLSEFFFVLSLCIFFYLVASPLESILIVTYKGRTLLNLLLVTEFLRSFFIVIFVFVNTSLLSALFGLLLFSIIKYLIYVIYCLRNFDINKFSVPNLKNQLVYAYPLALSTIIGSFFKKLDQLLLINYRDSETYADYSVGLTQVPFVESIFDSIGSAFFPRALDLLKENKISDFLKLWNKTMINLSFIGIGIFFILQLISYDFITLLFTEAYSDSVEVFQVAIFLLLSKMLMYGTILKSRGLTNLIFISNFLSFIISIPLMFFMINEYGMIGAVIAMVTIHSLNALSQIYFSKRELNVSWNNLLPLRKILSFMSLGLFTFIIIYYAQIYIFSSITFFDSLLIVKLSNIFFTSLSFLTIYILSLKYTRIFNLFDENWFMKILVKFGIYRGINR